MIGIESVRTRSQQLEFSITPSDDSSENETYEAALLLVRIQRIHCATKPISDYQRQALHSNPSARPRVFSSSAFEGLQKPNSYNWEDGTCTKVTFVHGRLHGPATLMWPDGTRLEFEYVHDIIKGKAKVLKIDGSTIEFTYVNEVAHGKAKRIFKDGTLLKYTYVQGIRQGPAKATFSDGTTGEFAFANDKPIFS